MKSYAALPDGYNKKMNINLLTDKKPMMTVNILSFAILAASLVIGFFISPLKFNILSAVLICPLLLLYILLHELVHGIFMRLLSGIKPSYGYKVIYAYAGSKAYFSKIHYTIIALAPIVIWGIVLALICYFLNDTKWFWLFYITECMNLSGAAGDIYITFLFSKMPKDILIKDTGIDMTVYTKD